MDTRQLRSVTRNRRTGVEPEARQASRSSRSRTGFTVVELLIALVLLDVGLVALVRLAGSISRDSDSARSRATALSVASGRLEKMASLTCQGGVSGVAQESPGLTEWFSEIPAPNATRIIVDSVAYSTPQGTRTFVLRTGARC